MANSDSTKHASDQSHESYADDAKARRVLKVDSTGTISGGTVATAEFVKITDGTLTADIKTNVNTTNNEVLVNLEGHSCDDNTSDTPLGAGASFTGTDWQDTLDYGTLSVNVVADQDSATDGLEIQWSHDGVNPHDYDKFTILANNAKTFTFGPAERYYRLKYTNGATPQGSFHINSQMRRCYVKPSSHRIQDSIVGEDDAELMKSVITGLDGNNVFQNVKVSSVGNLQVDAKPYTYAIAEGEVVGHSANLKFGTRTTIAANTPSTIWEGPTALYAYMSSAQQLKVSSTDNTNDNVGGTGALTLTIYGLDTNYAEISETITMTGTTVVTTNLSYIRVFRAYVATCGTSYSNTGTISIKNNAGAVTQAIINIGESQTLMSIWTVPTGKVMYLTQGTASTNSNKGARISLFTRLNNGGTLYPWRIRYRAYLFSGNEVFPFQIPFAIPAKTDIEVRFNTPGSAGNTSGGATFEYWYEDA